MTRAAAGPPAAVVVNHDAGEALAACVASLDDEGATPVVVVDNGSQDGSLAQLERLRPATRVVQTGRNLGYGAGANRGIAATAGELVVVANPDIVVHPGALQVLTSALAGDPALAIVGPRISDPDGAWYPSARRFPAALDAAGHMVLGTVAPRNRFTRRYRMDDLDGSSARQVDWVSGACLVARRQALEELGGFDESYFMYAEDMDLCWRARRAGWAVAYVPAAEVTHVRGVSTAQRPYRMLAAHHRSALRFASRVESGWRRPLVAPAAVLLGLRFLLELGRLAVTGRPGGASRSRPPRSTPTPAAE